MCLYLLLMTDSCLIKHSNFRGGGGVLTTLPLIACSGSFIWFNPEIKGETLLSLELNPSRSYISALKLGFLLLSLGQCCTRKGVCLLVLFPQ